MLPGVEDSCWRNLIARPLFDGNRTGIGDPGLAGVRQPDDALREEVRRTEIAFARTMADRDFAAFQRLIADDVVWLGSTLMRGKQQVAEGWKRFYEEKDAPFSWEPEQVEVNNSGTLGVSTWPVRDPEGRRIGTYNSIWRRERDRAQNAGFFWMPFNPL